MTSRRQFLRGTVAAAVSAALPALPTTNDLVVDNKLRPAAISVAEWAHENAYKDFVHEQLQAIAKAYAMPYSYLSRDWGDTSYQRCRDMFVFSDKTAARQFSAHIDPRRGVMVGFDTRDGQPRQGSPRSGSPGH